MKISRKYINNMLVSLGHLREDQAEADIRNDAGETATFARSLEYVISEVYKVEYPERKARVFIPVNTNVPAGAESYVWRLWDWRGMAKIISNYADDLPTVELMAAEISQLCKGCGIGYYYSLQDIRASSLMGINIDTEKGSAARLAHENLFDYLAAKGDAANGLPGFLNNPNVPVMSAPGDITGGWDTATTEQILDDLHAISAAVYTNTKGSGAADTMLFPPIRYKTLAVKRMSAYDSTPVLRAFLNADPYIKSVDQWSYLDTADAAGTGPRLVCYPRDPKVVSVTEPMPFTQHPPQTRNLGFTIPCESRVGGVNVRQPLKMLYVDDI